MRNIDQVRVLLCAPNQRGGVSVFCQVIADTLPGTVDYFLLGRRKNKKSWLGNVTRMIADYWSFVRRLSGNSYDLIHLNPSLDFKAVIRDGIFLLIAKIFRKKALVFVHGWTESFEGTLRKRWIWLFSRVYNMADAVVVLSSVFSARLVEMGISKKIHIMTTLVADNVIHKTEDALMAAGDRKHTLQCTILFMSRVEKDKGIFETLEAYADVKGRNANIRLIVAGDGAELEGAKEFVRRSGIRDVTFAGWVEESVKIDYLLHSDIYLFPTNHGEGIPISLLEAMAAGLPVITTPMGGITDFFEDQKMGLLVTRQDPGELARAVERLSADDELRLRMGRYNHQYARSHFSASIVAGRLENIYREVIHVQ